MTDHDPSLQQPEVTIADQIQAPADDTGEIRKTPEQATLQEIVEVIRDKTTGGYEHDELRQCGLFKTPDSSNDDMVEVTFYKEAYAERYRGYDEAGKQAQIIFPKSHLPSDSTYGPNKLTNYSVYITDKGTLSIKKGWAGINNIWEADEGSFEDVMARISVRKKKEDAEGLRTVDEQEAQELLDLVREWQPRSEAHS